MFFETIKNGREQKLTPNAAEKKQCYGLTLCYTLLMSFWLWSALCWSTLIDNIKDVPMN